MIEQMSFVGIIYNKNLVRSRSRFGDLLPECELAETLRPDVRTDATLPIPAFPFPNEINLAIIPKMKRDEA